MRLDDLLNNAKAEIGTTEYPAGSNKQKYGEAYGWNGVPWCVIFCWWVFDKTESHSFPKVANCSGVRQYAQTYNKWVVGNYIRGDCVIYDFGLDGVPDHIGIVASDIDPVYGTFISIEGNTSMTSDDNGGAVMMRVRDIKYVMGAYRPEYEDTTTQDDKEDYTVVQMPTLKKGDEGTPVKALQEILLAVGIPYVKRDGKFGVATESAVMEYQKLYDLEVDGIVGPITWASLWGA